MPPVPIVPTHIYAYLRLSGDAVSADDLPDGVDLLELLGELLHHVGDGADVHVEQLVQVLVVPTDLQVVVPPHHPLRRDQLQGRNRFNSDDSNIECNYI